MSTNLIASLSPIWYVPITVMPKGVEHVAELEQAGFAADVPITVMPKGVEHYAYDDVPVTVYNVPITVMPKGVEHEPIPDRARFWNRRANHSDAERR